MFLSERIIGKISIVCPCACTCAMRMAPRVHPVFAMAEGCEAIDSFVSSASSAHQSSSTETDESSHTSTTEVYSSLPSWFDKLRTPQPLDLARTRKIDSNPPPVGRKRSTSGSTVGKHDPKTVTPSQRVREFPGEHLTASGGQTIL